MEEAQRPRKRGQASSWKNHVEQDLKRLLERNGVIGAFLVTRNGETIAQVFQETLRQRESTLMQYAKKLMPLVLGLRTVPLRRTVFETREGSIILYNMDNGVVGCMLDRDFDILAIMLELRTVGDLINSHLNNAELDRSARETLLRENRKEFRALNAELLRQIENHWGPIVTEQLIERTVR